VHRPPGKSGEVCQAMPAKYSPLPNFGFAVSSTHPGQEGATRESSRIVARDAMDADSAARFGMAL